MADFDAETFVKGSRMGGGPGCQTCLNPAAVARVREILEAMIRLGRRSCSVQTIRDHLADELGHDLSEPAIRNHVTKCERELYSQVKRLGLVRR